MIDPKLEEFYQDVDPWNYQKTADDITRKETILIHLGRIFDRALDIGCGEGWITQDLPARKIYGCDVSVNALSRLPDNVSRLFLDEIKGSFDLIIATGVLYKQYDYQLIADLINEHASETVLTCNIKDWEIPGLIKGRLVLEKEFPYREYTQQLRIYDFATQPES